jgi:hypothetical protein
VDEIGNADRATPRSADPQQPFGLTIAARASDPSPGGYTEVAQREPLRISPALAWPAFGTYSAVAPQPSPWQRWQAAHAHCMHGLARADCCRSGGSRLRAYGPVSRARSKVPGAGSTLGLSKPPWIRMGVSSATELVVDGSERIVTSSHLFNRSICPKPSMVPSDVARRIGASGPARPCKSAMASRQVMRTLPFRRRTPPADRRRPFA